MEKSKFSANKYFQQRNRLCKEEPNINFRTENYSNQNFKAQQMGSTEQRGDRKKNQ